MPKPSKIPLAKDKTCEGCHRRPRWSIKSKYCQKCSKSYQRMRNKGYPPEAVQGFWDYIDKYDYVCAYTQMALDLDNPKSSRYMVFDHVVPGDPRKIVPCTALANTMKTDMLVDEFKDAVCQIADHFRLGKPVNIKDPVHWCRLFPKKTGSSDD
ncbi:MAG: hypothetical protein KGJ95_02965 [Candidatus Omnitrophica bacterium]|nr:hypothetical protein [Candidatus Omnitrophota bacterium]